MMLKNLKHYIELGRKRPTGKQVIRILTLNQTMKGLIPLKEYVGNIHKAQPQSNHVQISDNLCRIQEPHVPKQAS